MKDQLHEVQAVNGRWVDVSYFDSWFPNLTKFVETWTKLAAHSWGNLRFHSSPWQSFNAGYLYKPRCIRRSSQGWLRWKPKSSNIQWRLCAMPWTAETSLRSSLGEARSMVEIAVGCKMNFPQVSKHRMSCGMGHCSDAGWQCMPFDGSIALQSCAGHQVNCRALPHVLMSCEFPVHNLVAKSKYLLIYVDYILWEHHSPDHPWPVGRCCADLCCGVCLCSGKVWRELGHVAWLANNMPCTAVARELEFLIVGLVGRHTMS